MKITLLGTGSPEPSTRRASSGYLVEIGDNRILLDCGGGVYDRLVQSGRLPSDITHLFFTHLHTDHMMDYARLVHAAWDEGGKPLKVWGPAPIASINQKLFGADGVFAHDLMARTEFRGSQEVWLRRGGTLPRDWPKPEITEIEPGYVHEGNGWRLSSCSVPHAQPWLTCMGFRIDAGGKSFVYSGDAGYCKSLEAMAKGCDLLLHWCYRMTGDEADEFVRKFSPTPMEIAQLANRCGAKQLLITHFRNSYDNDEMREKARSEMREHFEGPSDIAEDLMVIDL